MNIKPPGESGKPYKTHEPKIKIRESESESESELKEEFDLVAREHWDTRVLKSLAVRVAKTEPPSEDDMITSENYWLWVVGPVAAAKAIMTGICPLTILEGTK